MESGTTPQMLNRRHVMLGAVGLLGACQPRYKLVEEGAPAAKPVAESHAPSSLPEETPGEPRKEEPSIYRPVEWGVLRELNTRSGDLSASLKKLEGGAIRLTGYMVPFADENETADEFLLVPEAGMCVHTPPPPANQIVFVQMTSGAARVTFAKPVEVSGILSIVQSDSPYGKVGFKIEAAQAKEDTTP
ncbi:MAG: DUF3299 domain-containing protein [Acidobacteria bacterium]|nr:DUF3299 domain-containing protein [Acidobacteriota bacterium]